MPEQMPSDDQQLNLDELRMGYLTCPVGASNDYLGGLLVVDGHSLPKHFAYVDAVRPTLLQRLLYSLTLETAARVDTIGRELLGSLSDLPSVLFIDDDALRSITRLVQCPVAHIRASENKSRTLKSYIYDIMGDHADNDTVRSITNTLDDTVNLLEPFERIRDVLEAIEKGSHTDSLRSQVEPQQ